VSIPNPQRQHQRHGMTEEERSRHRTLILAGAALLIGPILVGMLLSAAQAPLDPKFTAPVFGALMVAGAGALGQAMRLKRDAGRRG
jgi:hypothetical protein